MDDSITDEYPISKGLKLFYGLLAVVMPVLAIAGWHFTDGSKMPLAIRIGLVIFLLFMMILLLGNYRRRLTISNTTIYYTGILNKKELPLSAIKGRRKTQQGIVLEPVSTEYPEILIVNYSEHANSKTMLEWINNSFPNLDAADLETAGTQLLQDDTLADTETSGQQLLRRARILVMVYNIAAVIIAVLCIMFRGRLSQVTLLLLPLVGVALLFTHRGLIKFFSATSRSIYPGVMIGCVYSSMFLLASTLFTWNILEWKFIIYCGLAAFVLVVNFLYKKGFNPTAGQPKSQVFIMVMAALAYGFGAVTTINCAFDQTKPTPYTARVQECYITTSKGKNHYHIRLAPWGPKQDESKVEVGYSLYNMAQADGAVTVRLKKGLLAAPWYWVEREDALIQTKPVIIYAPPADPQPVK